ncbi:MAG: hypothetical protein AAGD86_07170 [Pseudomonadota bacterium]
MAQQHNNDNDRMVRHIGALLERSAQRLDAEHADALRAARKRAVQAAEARSSLAGVRWLPLAAAASVAALAVTVALRRPPTPAAPPPADELVASIEASDYDMLLGEESLDMLAELEFYDWLSAEADAG